jgi:predicted DNA-binding protein (MmcQ/YjbR family)
VLGGIIYEVTLQVKPIEALHFAYVPRSIDQLSQADVDSLLDSTSGFAHTGRDGWITVDASGELDWDEIRELVQESYCLNAP